MPAGPQVILFLSVQCIGAKKEKNKKEKKSASGAAGDFVSERTE